MIFSYFSDKRCTDIAKIQHKLHYLFNRLSESKIANTQEKEKKKKKKKKRKQISIEWNCIPAPVSCLTTKIQNKKISNDQKLIQSDPISCLQNQKGNN